MKRKIKNTLLLLTVIISTLNIYSSQYEYVYKPSKLKNKKVSILVESQWLGVIHRETGSIYDQDGYDVNGYNSSGVNREGYDINGEYPVECLPFEAHTTFNYPNNTILETTSIGFSNIIYRSYAVNTTVHRDFIINWNGNNVLYLPLRNVSSGFPNQNNFFNRNIYEIVVEYYKYIQLSGLESFSQQNYSCVDTPSCSDTKWQYKVCRQKI